MSLIIHTNDLRTNGQSLYKTNTTMRDIATIMEHPEFKSFFGKYFNDSTDAHAMLMLMKIYQSIPSDDPYEKIAVLHKAMDTSEVRAMIMDSFNNWRNGDKPRIEDKPKDKPKDKLQIADTHRNLLNPINPINPINKKQYHFIAPFRKSTKSKQYDPGEKSYIYSID